MTTKSGLKGPKTHNFPVATSAVKSDEKPELKATPTKPEDLEAKERKRKMMAERKLLLKKKLSAIKIQKYWRQRARKRRMRLEILKHKSAVRILQKWAKGVIGKLKAKREILEI